MLKLLFYSTFLAPQLPGFLTVKYSKKHKQNYLEINKKDLKKYFCKKNCKLIIMWSFLFYSNQASHKKHVEHCTVYDAKQL